MSNRMKDRTGQVYGQLRAIEVAGRRNGSIFWTMECLDCGERREVRSEGMRAILRCKKCGFRKDRAGQRSGSLTVTDFSHSQDRKTYWNVVCDCGKRLTLPGNALSGKKAQRYCGQSCPTKVLNDEQRIRRRRLISYKAGARSRDLTWELSDDEAWALMQSDCFWCEVPPTNVTYWQEDARTQTATWPVNGIDRLDSKRGYEEGNCVPCCARCNQIKADLSSETFLTQIGVILRHQKLA